MAEPREDEQTPLPIWMRDPMGMLKRRWRWMLFVATVGIGATAGVWMSLPVSYTAVATLLIESQQIPEDLVRPTVQQDPYERINALISQMNAREQLAGVIQRRNLYPELRQEFTMPEVVELMREDIQIVAETGVGMRRRRSVDSIYSIQYSHLDPLVAADVTNELAGLIAASNTEGRAAQARNTTEFLARELQHTQLELQEAEGAITDFKELHRGELPSELATNLAKLERLGQEAQSLTQQIAEAETRLALSSAQSGYESTSSPGSRLAALRSQLAAEEAVHTDEHPNVVSLKRQVAALEAQMAEGKVVDSYDPARRVLVSSSERSITDMRARMVRVNQELIRREKAIARTPEHEEELRALESRAMVLREKHLNFLRKVEAAELAEALESSHHGSKVTVLDEAVPPSMPDSRRLKIALMGLLGSLGLAAALGVLLEILDPVLVTADQIEDVFGISVLGSVPRIS